MPAKIIKRILIFAPIILILSVIYVFYNKPKCHKLGCISIKDWNEYKPAETYRDEKDKYSALYKRDEDLLRAEIIPDISISDAEKLIDAKITRIKAQFENSRSPYPGEISDEIICDNKFKPEFRKGYMIAYLNNRLTYGSCIEEENVYRSIEVWKYCDSQQKLYQLEFIYPLDKFKEEKLEISCLN